VSEAIGERGGDRVAHPGRYRDWGGAVAWAAFGLLLLACVFAGHFCRAWVESSSSLLLARESAADDLGWGMLARDRGMINTYDRTARAHAGETPPFALDAPPLRLALLEGWAAWSRRHFAWARQIAVDQSTIDSLGIVDAPRINAAVVGPMWRFDEVIDAVAAIAAFCLARRWTMRRRQTRLCGKRTCPAFWWQGLLAFALVWLNPAIILHEAAWPTHDLGAAALFMLALLACGLEAWFWAGILLAIGAGWHGELLIVAPIFILWPLLLGKISAIGRCIGGFALGAVVIAAPLLARGSVSWFWVSWVSVLHQYAAPPGEIAMNLAAIFDQRYNWNVSEVFATYVPRGATITLGGLLLWIWAIMTLICAIGMARRQRRRDPRFLVAACGAWLMCFAFLPNTGADDLLNVAAVGACLAAVSLGFVLLDAMLAFIAWVMMMHALLIDWRWTTPVHSSAFALHARLWAFVSQTSPAMGWAVLLCAAVFAFYALAARGTNQADERSETAAPRSAVQIRASDQPKRL
jgi:hypothetical protein